MCGLCQLATLSCSPSLQREKQGCGRSKPYPVKDTCLSHIMRRVFAYSCIHIQNHTIIYNYTKSRQFVSKTQHSNVIVGNVKALICNLDGIYKVISVLHVLVCGMHLSHISAMTVRDLTQPLPKCFPQNKYLDLRTIISGRHIVYLDHE